MQSLYFAIAEGSATTTDFTPIMTALQSSISTSDIVSIIASGLGIAVGFVVLWWGSRKLVGMVMSAFKSGRIKF